MGAAPQALPESSESGVDLTQIRWMLSLTPRERLEVLQSHVEATLRLMERATEKRGVCPDSSNSGIDTGR